MGRARKKPPAQVRRATRHDDLPRRVDWTHPRVVQIFDAATRCFAREGFADTTVAQIAAEAELTKSTIHYYFDGKQTLILELQAFVYTRLFRQIEDALDSLGPAPTLRDALAAMLVCCRAARPAMLQMAFVGEATRDAEMKARIELAHRRMEELATRLLVRTGHDPGPAPLLVAALFGLTARSLVTDDEANLASCLTLLAAAVGPDANEVDPEPDDIDPKPDAIDPKPDDIDPEPDAIDPEPDGIDPEPDDVDPEPDDDTAEPELNHVEPDREPARGHDVSLDRALQPDEDAEAHHKDHTKLPTLPAVAPPVVVPPHANWFVGLAVPAGGWFEPFIATAPSHLRRFHPEDLHLTLAFLGACGESRATHAWAEALIYRGEPIRVTLGRLVGMGNPRRPSALSLLLKDGRQEAVRMMEDVRTPMLQAASAKPDKRPPKPHVTLARPSRKANASQRHEAFTWALSQPEVGAQVMLDTICLYTWSADRPARQFRVVASRRLGSS